MWAGKYWFPNYERSDETVHVKEGDFPVRLVIKWTDFKPLAAAVSDTAPAPGGAGSPIIGPGEFDGTASPQARHPRSLHHHLSGSVRFDWSRLLIREISGQREVPSANSAEIRVWRRGVRLR